MKLPEQDVEESHVRQIKLVLTPKTYLLLIHHLTITQEQQKKQKISFKDEKIKNEKKLIMKSQYKIFRYVNQ